MDTNKSLITVLIIIIAAASASYFEGNNSNLTGQATGTLTKISVSPSYLSKDNRDLTVTIMPGSAGADRTLEIHRFDGDPNSIDPAYAPGNEVYVRNRYCLGLVVCKDTITVKFTFGSNDNGQYYATVRDCNGLTNPSYTCKTDGKYVKAFFNVEKSRQAEELPKLFTIPIQPV